MRLLRSNSILPSKPVTSATSCANSAIVQSWPAPTLMWDILGETADQYASRSESHYMNACRSHVVDVWVRGLHCRDGDGSGFRLLPPRETVAGALESRGVLGGGGLSPRPCRLVAGPYGRPAELPVEVSQSLMPATGDGVRLIRGL